ncbi:hypothetical protein [Subtercola sp. YIM 133946]|uniref:hypothetical protein n=1 Tax=Subtercola sp. YIM 133946 TaxID=3118909 RepID=UPI002F923980
MPLAAECWRIELRARTPRAWRGAIGYSFGPFRDFVCDGPDLNDLIFISIGDGRVASLRPAGDGVHSERMLAIVRHELLTCDSAEFAREWGLAPAPAAHA